MKKIQVMLIGLFGLMISGMASAQVAYPELGGGTNPITMVDCTLLANDVAVVLTNNVVGGMQCNTLDNFVALSLCHSSGLTISRSAVVLDQNGDGTVDCTVTDTENCVVTVEGSAFPTANTARGTVSSLYPGDVCNTANALANAGAQVLPQ